MLNWILINEMLCCETCWSCICDNANAWVALTGIALSFIGVVLSYVGLRQIGKARKDIAYSQVKIQQTEIMNKLLLHLNRLTLHANLCSFDKKNVVVSQKYYECNIFELKAILNANADEYKNDVVYFHQYACSLLYADEFLTNGFLDKAVANALVIFDPKTSVRKIENPQFSNKGVLLIEGDSARSSGGGNSLDNLHEIGNGNVNTVGELIKSIGKLEEAIYDWHKRNGVEDCNILINPNNLKPQIEIK